MKKINVNFIISAIAFVLFAALTAVVSLIDVQAIGPDHSEIGLASINGYIRDFFGVNMIWYDVTEIFGFVAIASAGVFAVLGLYQLVTRKSLKKVDPDIYVLAGLYILVLAAYVFFEIFVINCRPILMEGELEASFPSSHSMIVICFVSGAIHQIHRRISNRPLRMALEVVGCAVIALTVVGRMICGVHWFTDIVGGMLLGIAIVFLYVAFVDLFDKKNS